MSAVHAPISNARPTTIATPSNASCSKCVNDSATPEVCGRSVRRWQRKSHSPADNQTRYREVREPEFGVHASGRRRFPDAPPRARSCSTDRRRRSARRADPRSRRPAGRASSRRLRESRTRSRSAVPPDARCGTARTRPCSPTGGLRFQLPCSPTNTPSANFAPIDGMRERDAECGDVRSQAVVRHDRRRDFLRILWHSRAGRRSGPSSCRANRRSRLRAPRSGNRARGWGRVRRARSPRPTVAPCPAGSPARWDCAGRWRTPMRARRSVDLPDLRAIDFGHHAALGDVAVGADADVEERPSALAASDFVQ
jgi:hypothetical protein